MCLHTSIISYLIILPTEFEQSVKNELSLIRVKLEDRLKEPLILSESIQAESSDHSVI